MTAALVVAAVLAWLVALHTCTNAMLLRRPPCADVVTEPVSLLVPARDEAARIGRCIAALTGQRGLADVELVVYDDGSHDGTAQVVRQVAGAAATVMAGGDLPAGWLGKPHACARLSAHARGSVLVFVDADVVLTPDAVARAVALLRRHDLQLVSPYPRLVTGSLVEHLVQPLPTWSWLAFLPLRRAERSPRTSLAAAAGQFLVVDAAAYRRAGGHGAVRTSVVEDVALARAMRAAGGRGGFVDGRDLATCRMYDDARAVVEGYAKSLWCAFGSPAGGVAVAVALAAVYVAPLLAVAATPLAWAAPAAGIASRVVAQRRSGAGPWWGPVLHPVSVLAFAGLVVVSIVRHRSGAVRWKGRVVA